MEGETIAAPDNPFASRYHAVWQILEGDAKKSK